jgi:4a-hydroxytetrahydrobiopterin dehydratase
MAKNEPQTYSEQEIRTRLGAELPGWRYEDGWIRRDYRTDGWPTTLMLVNQIGYLAEAAYHHPDLSASWARVEVRLQTHSAGGITDLDFQLARKVEDTVLWRPGPDSALEGTPNEFVRGGDSRPAERRRGR